MILMRWSMSGVSIITKAGGIHYGKEDILLPISLIPIVFLRVNLFQLFLAAPLYNSIRLY